MGKQMIFENQPNQPVYIGYIACFISVILFGSNLAIVKKYDTGDGFFFNWVYCSAIWVTGLAVNIWQNSPVFYPLALVGGFLWATGGLCVSLILKYIGLGLGLCIWATFNMIVGWACGRFGLFGIEKSIPQHLVLNYVALFFAITSALFYLSVKTDIQPNNDIDLLPQHNTIGVGLSRDNDISNSSLNRHRDNQRRSSSTTEIYNSVQPLLLATRARDLNTIDVRASAPSKSNYFDFRDLRDSVSPEGTPPTNDESGRILLPGEAGTKESNDFSIISSHTPSSPIPVDHLDVMQKEHNLLSIPINDIAQGYDIIDDDTHQMDHSDSIRSYSIPHNNAVTIGSIYRDPEYHVMIAAVDKKRQSRRRIVGSLLAIVAGCLYGVNFIPVIYIQDNYPNASKRGLPYIFAHFSGIYLTATIYFLGYAMFNSLVRKKQPWISSRMIIPTFISGILWSIATCAWFVANEILSQTVSFPIIASLPAIIAGFWALVVFHEIKGRRNITLLFIAFSFSLTGAILAGLSF